MTGTIRLDVHAHLIPVDTGLLSKMTDVSFDEVAQAMTIDGYKVGIKELFRPDLFEGWMDKSSVGHAFLSSPPPTYRQHLRGEEAYGWTRYLNDGLQKIAAGSNRRMSVLVHLPNQDTKIALRVANEAIASGIRLFSMPTGTGDDRTLADSEFAPLWYTLNNERCFVFLHPGECSDRRLKPFYLTNLIGNPYETTVTLAHLMFSGVLERYTDLTLCFAHGGGLLPMAIGRLQRGFDTGRPGIDTSRAGPMRVRPNVYTDCICHSQAAATNAEATFGPNNVVFGSDWPFPMGLLEPHEQLADFDEARRKAYFDASPNSLLARLNLEGMIL
ncbi:MULTISPECIES: amidohydrolase family protein [unclassified Rhizobium]|uniref:amidohydrolase family protein n=1 Tax=unclassified Rhizobium TaxID=2613769 RepID=UPI00288C2D22|nr:MULTISPECIES: amidohydrolase family protein [unclassified Rhizobium]